MSLGLRDEPEDRHQRPRKHPGLLAGKRLDGFATALEFAVRVSEAI